MDNYDKAIIYIAKLKEVSDNIKKLENLSFNVRKIKENVNNLESNVSKEINEIYEKFNDKNNNFLQDSLKMVYVKASIDLDKINRFLKEEYENYYKIVSLYDSLKEKVDMIDKNNIDEFANNSLLLLESIKKSSTVDYEMEKGLVLNIYKLVYDVMKYELVYRSDSTLFIELKNDKTNFPYVIDYIKDDIQRVTNNNVNIKKILSNIKTNELDDSYLLDKNLLFLLAISENKELLNIKVDDLKNIKSEIEKYEQELVNNENEKNSLNELFKDNLEAKGKIKHSILKKRIITFVDALIVSLFIMKIAPFISKNVSKEKLYKTITTKYDSYTDTIDVEEFYKSETKDKVKLTEYSPWSNPGYFRELYERNVYTYSSFNGEYDNIKEILTSNKKENIKYDLHSEKTKTLPDDYGYGENKYVIEKTKINKNDFIYAENKNLLFISYAVSLLILLIDLVVIYSTVTKQIKRLKMERKENTKDYNDLMEINNKCIKKIDELNVKINSLKEVLNNNLNVVKDSLGDEEKIKKLTLTR